MKTTILYLIIFSMTIFFVITSCDNKKYTERDYIQPPFEKLDPAFQAFTLYNQKGDTLELETGTRIIVPAGAFADTSGKPVQGKVDLKYREFHDALDIFLAGIPMNYNVRGEKRHLQTAGMFEIRAGRKGDTLQLAEGKRIKVDLGSQTRGAEYNFFGFDEKNGTWDFMGYPESRPNPERAEIREQIRKLGQTRKIPMEPGRFSFDYTGAMDIYKYRFELISPAIESF